MKLGISSYTFTWAVGVPGNMPEKRLSAPELLHLAKSLGVSLVQIADNMPLHEMGPEQHNALAQLAGNLGIEIETGSRLLNEANLEAYISIAERFGSKILRFVIDGPGYRPNVEEVVPIVKNAVPELEKRGITLAIENHDRMFVHDLIRLIESAGSRHVGICLDCANSMGVGEGFHEVVTALAPYTVNFHLKEISIKRKYHMMGFDIEGKPFGEGCLPLEWMMGQLPETCKTAILEQWTPPEETIELSIAKELDWAEKSIAYLRRYFDI